MSDNNDRIKKGWGDSLLSSIINHIQNSPGNPKNWHKEEENDNEEE